MELGMPRASAFAAAGCAIKRSERTEATLTAHREQVVNELVQERECLSRKMVARIVEEQDRAAVGSAEPVLDFLIISGGGDYGAFGAGVLKGWGTITQPATPARSSTSCRASARARSSPPSRSRARKKPTSGLSRFTRTPRMSGARRAAS
jgi:hypothetical protein